MQDYEIDLLPLVDRSREFATSLLRELDNRFEYHDLSHTQQVVDAAREIGKKSGLRGEQMENVLIAAWFHDTGYSCDVENHEAESARIMQETLQSWQVDEDRIATIAEIILATRMPQQPVNLMCRILCDADLYHLSDPDFIDKSEKLRRELNNVCRQKLRRSDWMRISFHFIRQHCYFTEYGRKILGPRKNNIIRQLRNRFSFE